MKRPVDFPSFRTEQGKRTVQANVVRKDDVQRRWSVLLLVVRAIRRFQIGAHRRFLRRLQSNRRATLATGAPRHRADQGLQNAVA